MADDVVALAAAAPGVLVLGKWAFDRFVSRADRTAEKVEADRSAAEKAVADDVKQVRSDMSDVKADMRVMLEKLTRGSEETRALKERIDGISSAYGPKLAALEEKVARLDERLSRGKR